MKTGEQVKFSAPEPGEESLRFVVLESHEDAKPPRVLVRLLDSGMAIAPVSSLSPEHLTCA